ncbi:glycosyltransferase [Actinosynnema sp. NPDC023587]|uniref:glycosyltransferase n=1 Tax=Actinosynnema sp. NPDC023587 TaxID=3154695 RepID=UPI0033D4A86F
MKIAVVSDVHDPVDAALARSGHDITVDEVGEDVGESVARFTCRWRTDPPDVVHARGTAAGVAALVASRESGLVVVQSFGGVEVGRSGDAERTRAERLVGREAAHVLAVSVDQRLALLGLGVRRSNISVVPAAVDTDVFHPDGPAAPRGAGSRLVAVGEPLPERGFQDVVAVLRSLPDTELVVAAAPGGPCARRLAAHADVCGVADRVRFDGRTALPALLRSADVVVCPARGEADPTVALRAMACGVPVVATAVGVLPETVVDGVTGRLAAPRDTAALARALRAVLSEHGLRQAFGMAAFDRVHARYAVGQIAVEVEKLFEGLVPSRAV